MVSINIHLQMQTTEMKERCRHECATMPHKSPLSGTPFILSFPSLHPPHSLPHRGNSSCMQVISVCSDGRSALIGWLNSYADVKIAGCVCQRANLLMVVTS